MSAASKRQIIETLDELPDQSLAAVAEFVDFLRAKALTGAPQPRLAKLGGLWRGHAFSGSRRSTRRGEGLVGARGVVS